MGVLSLQSSIKFFLERKERNEVIEIWGMILFIVNECKQIFF